MSPIPYIPEDERPLVHKHGPGTVGELTYLLSQTCIDFAKKYPRFADHAQVIAALECTKLEWYRMALAPYEDKAMAKNGPLDWPKP